MLTRQSILTTLKNAKSALEEKYGVNELALFGSYSRGDVSPNSDVDVMVDFKKPIGIRFIDLADELEQMLDAKVDLVSRKGIKQDYYNAIQGELILI